MNRAPQVVVPVMQWAEDTGYSLLHYADGVLDSTINWVTDQTTQGGSHFNTARQTYLAKAQDIFQKVQTQGVGSVISGSGGTTTQRGGTTAASR